MDEHALPQTGLLGRHPYTVMITESGSGVSRTGGLNVNRWRNDLATDGYGQWCYLMSVGSGKVWSTGLQPAAAVPDSYEADISSSGARFTRTDGRFITGAEVVAHTDLPAESRRITVTNSGSSDDVVEITSYQEVVLAPAISDRGHRAFSNLFVQTEWLPEEASLLAIRRPRSSRMRPVWCGHSVAIVRGAVSGVSFDTDRARFIGRGRTQRNPVAMDNPGDLSETSGAVLDPVMALRVRMRVDAGETVEVVFSTFAAEERAQAIGHARHFSQPVVHAAALHGSEDHVLAEAGLGPAWQARIDAATPHLIYGTGRAAAGTRDDILTLGITGEWPIAVARIAYEADIECAGDAVKLHRYWILKGIPLDLVILCATGAIADAVQQMVVPEPEATEGAPGIIVLGPESIDRPGVPVLESLARIHIVCSDGGAQVTHG